jgi:hypothetical protein
MIKRSLINHTCCFLITQGDIKKEKWLGSFLETSLPVERSVNGVSNDEVVVAG